MEVIGPPCQDDDDPGKNKDDLKIQGESEGNGENTIKRTRPGVLQP